jgi:hypothetical protein
MHSADLLPDLFDIVVKQWTGWRLRPEQRAVIPSILINCVGEAVLRRVQHELRSRDRDASLSEDITIIVTADRFSEEWLSRREIIDVLEYASGVPHELAALALTLIEFRVDGLLFRQPRVTISGLGTVAFSKDVPSDVPGDRPWRDWRLLALRDFETGSQFPRVFGWRARSALIDGLLACEAGREGRPYVIELAPSLAIRTETRERRELEIAPSDANLFELTE